MANDEWHSISEAARRLGAAEETILVWAQRRLAGLDSPIEARFAPDDIGRIEVRFSTSYDPGVHADPEERMRQSLARDHETGSALSSTVSSPTTSPGIFSQYWSAVIAVPLIVALGLLSVAYLILGMYNSYLWSRDVAGFWTWIFMIPPTLYGIPGYPMLSVSFKIGEVWSSTVGASFVRQLAGLLAVAVLTVVIAFGGEVVFRVFGSWLAPGAGMRAVWPIPIHGTGAPLIPIFGSYAPSLEDRREAARAYLNEIIELRGSYIQREASISAEVQAAAAGCDGNAICLANALGPTYQSLVIESESWVRNLRLIGPPAELEEFQRRYLLSAQVGLEVLRDAQTLFARGLPLQAVDRFTSGIEESLRQAIRALDSLRQVLADLGGFDRELDFFERAIGGT